MGLSRSQITPELLARMKPEDSAFYSPGVHPQWSEDTHPPPKNDIPENVLQRQFANWCLDKGYRHVWHGTHKRSTANRGCPDFIIAAKGTTFWIEFKRPGEDLSPDQSVFKKELEKNGVIMYVVYSAFEAIALIEKYEPQGVPGVLEGAGL
jgi:VRR-NUC domain-containing protein